MMYVTFFSAFLLSSISAYYSIIGLTTIFMGAFWPVVMMGIALELAKLVTASWLYQNWRKASLMLRTYLITAVVMLVMITSMGIFGFLAKSHIDSTMDNKTNATELETLNAEEQIINTRLQYLLSRAQTLSRSENSEIASNRIEREIKETQKQLSKLNQVKSALLKNENELVAHIGPLFYMAELFYKDPKNSVDKSVRLVIVAIMFVFDPLAVLLVIAGNMLAVEKRRREHPEEFIDPPPLPPRKVEPVKTVAAPTPPIQAASAASTSTNSSNSSNSSNDSQPNKSGTPAKPVMPASSVPSASPTPPVNNAIKAPTAAPAPSTPPAPNKPAEMTPAQLAEMRQQLASKLMTDKDVIAAFKLFYDRVPNSLEEIAKYKNMSSKQIVEIFYTSPEFLSRAGVASLILGAAKKMRDLKTKS
jgi:hypothetical protein